MKTQAHPSGTEILDRTLSLFEADDVVDAMNVLASELKVLRDASDPTEWARLVDLCRKGHPLLDRLRCGPVTGRSFRKPRGYAGDAETLDLIYALSDTRSRWSRDAQRVHEWELGAPASRAVRERARRLGMALDETATEHAYPRALSVACGHLREAHHSQAVAEGRIAKLFALDQDACSLEVVKRDHPRSIVETVQGSVRHLLARRVRFRDLDLIWSAGLYDYLHTPVAEALTRNLFRMLAPGGRLILVNFAPELPDIGYMETAMDWQLIYRSEQEMTDLAACLPGAQVSAVKTYREDAGNLVFLEVVRNRD